jgi:TENA/THI-4/PQQC family
MAHPTSPVRPRSSGCSQNHPRTARLRKVVRGRNDGLHGLNCVVGECEQRAHLLLVGSGRSSAGLQWLCAARDFAAECRAGVEYASMDAAELLAHVRAELAPVARTLAEHRYLVELESGRVPLESLRSFAGEQRAIIASDQESFEHLAHRFPAPPAAGFFRELAAGEAEALRLLERFAAAVGLGREYEPLAGCQAYSAYVAWLALNGSPADVALAFLANLETWGRSCARMRDALRPAYGDDAVAFFAFFAQPPAGFEERALALVTTGEPSSARRAARLLQAYELLYWDTLADGLH